MHAQACCPDIDLFRTKNLVLVTCIGNNSSQRQCSLKSYNGVSVAFLNMTKMIIENKCTELISLSRLMTTKLLGSEFFSQVLECRNSDVQSRLFLLYLVDRAPCFVEFSLIHCFDLRRLFAPLGRQLAHLAGQMTILCLQIANLCNT